MATNTEKTNTVIKNMKSLFGEILNQVKDLKGQMLKRKISNLNRIGFDLNYQNGFLYIQYIGFKSKKIDNYDLVQLLSQDSQMNLEKTDDKEIILQTSPNDDVEDEDDEDEIHENDSYDRYSEAYGTRLQDYYDNFSDDDLADNEDEY